MGSNLPTPLLITEPFGAGASNPTYITLPIPVPSQIGSVINQASFTDGFPPATMTPEASGGLPFFGQDMNGILWMITAYIACMAAGQFSTYNATQSTAIDGYPLGAMLLNAAGNGFWISTVNGNTTDPDTGGAGWFPVDGVGASAITLAGSNVALTALQAALPLLVFSGTLSANVVVTLPANEGQQWVIANECTGAFTVSVQTSGGSPIVIPQGGSAAPTSVYCDGTNIQNTGVSTAGLAPLASPTFTGTPAAPTAGTSSNTTQIATTAFVKNAIAAALAGYATLASPTFSGVPTVPTAPNTTNNTQAASTAFVQAVVGAGRSGTMGSGAFQVGAIIINFGVTALSTDPLTINFQTPFPTACLAIVATGVTTSGGSIPILGTSPPASSKTSFSCISSISSGATASWIAIGY